MATPIDSRRGRIALMVGHCAGMVDLVALPIWIGALVAHYRFDPQQAGALATLFLLGVVLASVALAPLFHRSAGRAIASAGFALAALAFGLAATRADFATLAGLHALAGVATGAALSVTHGSIARSAHPHRLFAWAGAALGVFAVVFVAGTPQYIAAKGGAAIFIVFAAVMAVAALVSFFAFPSVRLSAVQHAPAPAAAAAPISRAVWFGIAGIACMTVVQAMTFSFLERAGIDRGFERSSINAVLIALGIVNLFPAALAALAERHLAARSVLLAGPPLQAMLAIGVTGSTALAPYAVSASLFAAVIIFTHTFAFGLLARLEPSGRALAATPAMMMAGSAVGPLLGGTLVKSFGYGSLGIAAALLAAAAVFCFSRLPSAAAHSPREATA
ncbi:MAG: MFS transporter [Burkholderiales bacterium]|nr:MFS transporter [Burkholderiales bacterium]